MSAEYKAKNLQVLEGLDAVRMRPGMYIGTTGSKGLHHILWEIVDNAVDEAANGFARVITVKLYPDGSASVEDNGRGIPVDKHPKLNISGVEVVFTKLHAGGKFENNNSYTFSGGLHGVGASVTNALSRWLKVEVYKGDMTYDMRFESIEENGKIKSGFKVKELTERKSDAAKNGTFVHFMPDERVFGEEVFQKDIIGRRLKELAYLNQGLKIVLEDTRPDGRRSVFCFSGGIKDFAVDLNTNKKILFAEPIYVEAKMNNFSVELALLYSDGYTETMVSYVNNIPTTEGGTHEVGFKTAYTKVMNAYARTRNLLKDKDENLQGDDFREGMTAVLTVKMQNIQFEGQTKTKLGNPEVKGKIETAIADKLSELLTKPSIFSAADIITKKAIDAARVRAAARKTREIERKKNTLTGSNLVGKLASCSGKSKELRELFIVEGDSAGGSAKQGRDRSFQAILPLRGKPLNAEKTKLDKILSNEELKTIISAIGAGVDTGFDIKDINYDKIIILADADQDGAHIRSILLTFFFKYMKELIIDGHIYIGQPPLYKVANKTHVKYAYNDSELEKYSAELGKGYTVQRYKGLGEMNPEQLWETTMNPASRMLVRVNIDNIADAERMVSTLMGDDVEARKQYIYDNADFNKVDTFAKKAGANG